MEPHIPVAHEMKNVDILSFDGGGSKGIMEVSILSDVMRLATILWRDAKALSYLVDNQDISTNLNTRARLIRDLAQVSYPIHPNEIYDMIVGTSTGALIAFGLVGGKKGKHTNERLPMTLEECIEMYKKKTKQIFTKSWIQWFLSKLPCLRSIPITTYSKDNVKDVLLEQFHDCTLADFSNNKTVAGAVARSIGQREKLVLFDTKTEAYKLYKTYQVLQATSDAPVYFDTPVKIGDREFVDGGVGGNCPLAQAIPRAREIFGECKITSALSIAPPSRKESHVPYRFQVKYWLNYFVEMSTNGQAVYLDAKRRNRTTTFRRLSPRGESLNGFKLDEIDAEIMLKEMSEQKLDNSMFLVDVIATAAFVVDTYLGKTSTHREMTAEMAAKIAHMAGKVYATQSEYGLAHDTYNTSLSLWRKLGREENKIIIAEIYDDIADCLKTRGKYQSASSFYQHSVDRWRSYFDDTNTAKALFNLAECLLLNSRQKEAQQQFESALELQRKIYGKGTADAEVARTLNCLGWCHREQGYYNKAIEFYLQALEMRKQLYPEGQHLDIAETLNSLGLTFAVLGHHDKAVNYSQDSLEMRKHLIKQENHWLIAESLNNLGCCLMRKKKYNESRVNLEMALDMKKKLCEDVDHSSIAITLENLAKSLLNATTKNPESPLAYAQQALEMKKACFGDVSNAAIAKTLEIVGLCFNKIPKHEEATKYFMSSARMIEVAFGPNHPTLARLFVLLGHSLLKQNNYEDAKFYFNKASQIEIQSKEDSDLRASLAEQLETCAGELGKPKEMTD